MKKKIEIPNGNYRKKNGKWYFRIKVPDGLGDYKWTERLGGRLKSDAVKAYKEMWVNIFVENQAGASEYITVKRMINIWLDEYVDVECRENTQQSYHSEAKNHLLPALGHHKVADVTTRTLQVYVNSLRGKLAPGSIGHLIGTLKSAFNYGVNVCGFRATNPAEGLKLPKVMAKKPRDKHIFTREELDMMLCRFPADHQFHVPLQLMYRCGLRIGEALGLRWQDVDLENDELTVSGTMLDSGVWQDMPKTHCSARTIPFDDRLHLVLAMEWQRQKELMDIVNGYNYRDMVCVKGEHGNRMTANDMRFFNMWCTEAFGAGSCHCLRHTHASMLIAAGVPIELVSKRLGHSSVVTTSRIYSHVTKEADQNMRERLNAVL